MQNAGLYGKNSLISTISYSSKNRKTYKLNKKEETMLDKIKDKMKTQAHALNDAQEQANRFVKEVFEANVGNSENYILGVAQTEVDAKGGKAVALHLLANKILVDWTDHIVGVDPQRNEIIMLELKDRAVTNKRKCSGEFKIKKESFLMDEIMSTVKRAMKVPYRDSKDRYGRERFIIKDETGKTKLLIGSYLPEATDFPYDNAKLVEALKGLNKK